MPQNTPSAFFLWTATLLFGMATVGCRKDPGIIPPVQTQVVAAGTYQGADFYLLNEGNMGSNKASLDYFDKVAGTYTGNIYGTANPAVTLGLGDVGNDLAIYGNKLYVVVNGSNKVEVLDKYTATRLGQINIGSCRSIVFNGSKAYITSYNGFVGVIDTAARFDASGVAPLEKEIAVGREPEEMAILGDTLYVANSGGYSPPLYDHTLSVIDLTTEKEVRKIDVGINLNQVKKDAYGHIWVSSRGNYQDIDPSLYVLNASTGTVIRHFDIPIGTFTITGGILYYFSTPYDLTGQRPGDVQYGMLDVQHLSPLPGSFIDPSVRKGIKTPFTLAVDPLTHNVLLTDAGDNVSPGTLYQLDASGQIAWQVRTGDIPGHIAFLL